MDSTGILSSNDVLHALWNKNAISKCRLGLADVVCCIKYIDTNHDIEHVDHISRYKAMSVAHHRKVRRNH